MSQQDFKAQLQPGVNLGLTNAAYHAEKTHLSSSNLKLLLQSPAQFYKEKILGEKTSSSSAAMDLGTFVHALVLEPEAVEQEFAIFKGWTRRGTAFETFKAENPGKLIISEPMQNTGLRLAKSVQACPPALDLLKGGAPELSLATELQGVKLKARADYLNADKNYILDVKTTRHGSGPDTFKNTVRELGYELSAALYCEIASQIYGKDFDFYWLVISKSDIETEVYKASATTLANGSQLVRKALQIYKYCLKNNVWPDSLPTEQSEPATAHEVLEI